jgi:hypothetical protein
LYVYIPFKYPCNSARNPEPSPLKHRKSQKRLRRKHSIALSSQRIKTQIFYIKTPSFIEPLHTRYNKALQLRGVTFATEGMQDFMESTVGINNQDLVNKMEGFAIQGMRGLCFHFFLAHD